MIHMFSNALTVYHGTNELFDSFEEGKIRDVGFHFGTLNAAKAWGRIIYKCQLSIQTPLQMEDFPGDDWAVHVFIRNFPNSKEIQNLKNLRHLELQAQYAIIRKELEKQGL